VRGANACEAATAWAGATGGARCRPGAAEATGAGPAGRPARRDQGRGPRAARRV